MARTFLICLVIALLVAPSVFARTHSGGAGHHTRNGTRGGHHKSGGHNKSSGGSASGLTSSKGVTAGIKGKGVTQKKSCVKSSLGYKAATELGKGLLFHWTISGSTLNGAIEAKSTSGADKGYLSVGFPSKDGLMSPSDAVVGIKGGSVTTYKLTSYTAYTSSKLTVSSSSISTIAGSLVLKFSRPAKGGVKSLNLAGKNSIIWAFSKKTKFGTHLPTDRGSKSVDLSCVF
ncbi:hypothetical protein CLOM_g13883 [Closterium sp. NIES-68]|nr:hypothetical protein CLOM_g18795 [Closterium sp. NIES-68]GJP54859.1 hypothetical protein CLOM_g13883 [Closterium sp. NIES-68]GJP67036.1 hypothetical protein CLOP_g23911 [Closterium sp. NIES-67]GJP71009.1 hypothetical protein CLOP_g1893 [Closterium sp. NIES-67]